MRKIITLALVCAAILGCFSGCAAEEAKTINPDAVLQHLLTDIQYDAQLVDVGDLSSVYFTGMPETAAVTLHISSSGYFADEVAMISLASDADTDAAMAAIDTHLEQIRTQFQNYIPEELPKIDAAITWQSGNTIFLVITNDTASVNALFEKAHTFTAAASEPTGTQASTGTAVNETTGATTQMTTEATTEPVTEPTVIYTKPDIPLIVETEPATEPPTEPPYSTNVEGAPILVSTSGTYYVYPSGVVRVDNCAFEPYGYLDSAASTYAQLVSTVADTLAGQTNVYCMPIPTAISVTLPDDVRDRYGKWSDQGQQIENIFSKMSSNVIGINCYNNLMMHRNEYLYYRTDYHWNGPAAYYAYESFCGTRGFTPYTMEERKVTYFEGFLGTLYYSHSNCDPELGNTPDTVIAYHPVSESAYMFYVDGAGNRVDYPIIQDVSNWPSNCKYLCYAAADQAYAEFHNPEVTDGSVLILIKESYGNVLLSYLVDHYSVIYEIDYRYWSGDITQFAMEVGATDLLFANNMTMISAGVLVGTLGTIIP